MYNFSLILWSAVIIHNYCNCFTCQGSSYTAAINSCPDAGQQRLSAGGNVDVYIKGANNVPSTVSGKLCDPYVKLTVGSIVQTTRVIKQTTDPNWDEYLSLGFLGSATLITVEIWDQNYGIEFSDRLVVSSTVRVPFCSTMNANYSTIDCGEPFGCSSSESLWESPTRQFCNETGMINFMGTKKCASGMCLGLEFNMVPFTMNVEKTFKSELLTTPELTVAGKSAIKASFAATYGFPYLYDAIDYINTNDLLFTNLKGALMFRMNNNDKSYGKANEIKFYAGINFPANIYVCRYDLDNKLGIPTWLSEQYNSRNASVMSVQIITETSNYFKCYYQFAEGTVKNKWNGILSGAIPFYTNTIDGYDKNTYANQNFYNYMYIILAIPNVVAPREDLVEVTYDVDIFLQLFGSYGIVWIFFMFIVSKFLIKIDFRVDRLPSYLVTRVLTGNDKSLIAGLFLCYRNSPMNVQYRLNLYYAESVIWFILMIPLVLLGGWGFSCVALVRPKALGFFVAFGGISAFFLWFGIRIWERCGWRLINVSVRSLILSGMFFTFFLFSAILNGPAVVQYGYPVNLAALSLLFGTLNVLPLFILVFQQDKIQKSQLKELSIKMIQAVYLIKDQIYDPQGNNKLVNSMKINKLLHALLGEKYTINPNVPVFKLSTVLQEFVDDSMDKSTRSNVRKDSDYEVIDERTKLLNSSNDNEFDKENQKVGFNVMTELFQKPLSFEAKIYLSSVCILNIYLIVAYTRAYYPALALLNCFALLLLDLVHESIGHGNIKWSPGFKIGLLIIGRILVMGSSPTLWVLNYSATYLVYGLVLSNEIINSFLPMLSLRKSGEIVFIGKDITSPPPENVDVAGSAYFCLGALTFCFTVIIIISAFRCADGLLVPSLLVWGLHIQSSVFGMIAMLVFAIVSLLSATVRSFYLERHNLLRGSARISYMFVKQVHVPLLLAIFTELSILASGLLIYVATGATAVLVGSIFLPIIFICLGHGYRTWKKNDYELVIWPPRPKLDYHFDPEEDDAEEAMKKAFSMIENIFNKNDMEVVDVEDGPETDDSKGMVKPPKTLKGFKLPALKATHKNPDTVDIKLPPLPLKSVLRQKRENLGIKTTKSAFLKDNRGRDDAVDNDRFGDEDDVIDVNDPWAQYEINDRDIDDDDDGNPKKKKKVKIQSTQNQKCCRNKWILSALRNLWKRMQSNLKLLIGYCLNEKTRKVHPASIAYHAPERNSEKSDLDDLDENHEESNELNIESMDTDVEGGRVLSKKLSRKGTIALTGTKQESTEKQEGLKPEGVVEEAKPLNPSELPFFTAVMEGYLQQDEYIALLSWYGGMFAIMLFGIALAATVEPQWMGFVIWIALWSFLLAIIPMIKFFNTYTIDASMKAMYNFLTVVHFLFFISFLSAHYGDSFDYTGAVWTITYFFFYPVFLYIGFEIYRWFDSGYKYEPLDMNQDGKISLWEYLRYARSFPAMLAAMILFDWILYVWAGTLIGTIFTLIILTAVFGYLFLRDWTANEFFLSPELTFLGNLMLDVIMFITFFVALFGSSNTIFTISVFCFTYGFRCLSKVLAKVMTTSRDAVIYFSPYVFPIFLYDATLNDVLNVSRIGKEFLYFFITGIGWGGFMTVFYYPIDIGLALACGFFLALAAIASLAVSHVPKKLAKATALLAPEDIVEAATVAKEKFSSNQKSINFNKDDWDGPGSENDLPFPNAVGLVSSIERVDKTSLDKLKERLSIEVAVEMTNDIRSLSFVKPEKVVDEVNVDDDEEDEYELPWYRQMWQDLKDFIQSIINLIPRTKHHGYKRHSEAMFSIQDVLVHGFITGKGPFSFFLGFDGWIYQAFKSIKDNPNPLWHKYVPKWYDSYDTFGNNIHRFVLAEEVDTVGILSRLPEFDKGLDFTYTEEIRCAIYFLTILIVSADTKLQREAVLFQKFLRENKLRLASNGIYAPREIFTSASFASINIPLVAVWLSTLSDDERERFHSLKLTFSEEQKEKDVLIDQADAQFEWDALNLHHQRLDRDEYMLNRLTNEIYKQKEARIQSFANSLEGFYKIKFQQRRELWTTDMECYVEVKEKDLYDLFRNSCLIERDETNEFIQRTLNDIETGQRDARTGEYGRAVQYVDSEFLPGPASIGESSVLQDVIGWRCAIGVNETAQIFDNGTDPNDIQEGIFPNRWLTSALCMLISASDFGGGIINEQIMQLFIGHSAIDGEITLTTEVGAYCIKLYKNSQWIPIIIDDLFPMRKKEFWNDINKGLACAHTKECKNLWLSLIEKAFAKYYGSYAALEKGAIHHALQDLTGCESECILLSSASRGIGKRALWDQLVRYRKNGYVLGVGTGSFELADKGIQNIGIAFDSSYTIHDIINFDGHKLIKLRVPPGRTERWKGDWGSHSAIWSRRLRKRLFYQQPLHEHAVLPQVNATAAMEKLEEDPVFLMSFDDFCNVFRYLYICKYHSAKSWIDISHNGLWKKSDESEVEKMELMNQFMQEQEDEGGAVIKQEVDIEAQEKKKARARVDSASGLPNIHNPGCILENNPHYSLRIIRPTDYKLTVTQLNVSGVMNFVPHPVTILILKSVDPVLPMRLQSINPDLIVANSGLSQRKRVFNLYGTLPPGLYTILVATYVAGMEGSFTISVTVNNKCEFNPIWPPPWMLRQDGKERNSNAISSVSNLLSAVRNDTDSKGGKKIEDNKGKKKPKSLANKFGKGIQSLFGKSLDADGLEDDDEEEDDDDEDDDHKIKHKYDEEEGLH